MPFLEHLHKVVENATELHSAKDIEKQLDRMAKEITKDLSEADPIILCVMIGGVVPTGMLLTRLDFHLQVDYIHATRYQHALVGKEISWLVEPKVNLKNRTVLVVDDILDGGITLAAIVDFCKQKGASVVKTAVLVEKQDARLQGGLAKADYTGVVVENRFVYGYGMDYKGYLRNAPGIYALSKEHETA